jgi:putative transposase
MSQPQDLPRSQRWAQVRFAVVAGLLAQPRAPGELRAALVALAEQVWEHPATGKPVRFSLGSIRRWYYAVRSQPQPTTALARTVRKDAGIARRIDAEIARLLEESYRDYRRWTYDLHYTNLTKRLSGQQRQDAVPSYTTVRRYMRGRGMIPSKRLADRHDTPQAQRTQHRFEQREVRLYEHAHTHALWHTDAHHGSIALSREGELQHPILIAVIDDHARFILHAQWYWHEQARTVAHALMQAFAKRGLPRMLMSDNGGAFVAAEIEHGLHRLGIQQQTTLCYAPNQNGKMEVFWAQVEGRLMAMLVRQRDLDLYRLNELTQAWIEHEYHRRVHVGIDTTPLQRFQSAPHVGRSAPDGAELAQVFTRRELRRQRRSDGTISLGGKRFEIPNRYRHLIQIMVRYAQWDLDHVFIVNPDSDRILDRLLPIDPSGSASGNRREIEPVVPMEPSGSQERPPLPLPPLLQAVLDAARATGLPPAFIPLPEPQRPPDDTRPQEPTEPT